MWSTKYWEVEYSTSERRGIVAPKTIERPAGPNCQEQAAGSPGFTVDVFRTVKLKGKVKDEQKWTWTYVPTNAYKCISPKKKSDTKKKKDED
jgi:hypothetical protein